MLASEAHDRPTRLAAAALAAALLCTCAQLAAASPPSPPAWFLSAVSGTAGHCGTGRTTEAIGVSIKGWHSALILPVAAAGPLGVLLPAFPRAHYLSFGWGNRRFYTAAHPSSGDALAALFSSRSVLLVQAAQAASGFAAADARLYWLCADRNQMRRLDAYLSDALERRNGQPIDVGPDLLPDSRFYASTGRYNAFHTCNTWTMAALEYAGLRVRATGVIFAAQMLPQLQALHQCPPTEAKRRITRVSVR